MNKEEMTVGNWYISVKWKKPVYFEMEDMYELVARADGAAVDADTIATLFEPILFNEQWAIKFKFHKDNYDLYIKTKNNIWKSGCKTELCIKKCKYKGKFVWDVCLWHDDISTPTHLCFITYVHELQNVYRALYKKELINKKLLNG